MHYSFELNNEQIQNIKNRYKDYQIDNTTKYMTFRARIKNATLTIYTTNKVTIQGENINSLFEEISKEFPIINPKKRKPNEEKKVKFDFDFSIIGTDEVGTGDYFGPIIVCACFVLKDKILEVTNLGVIDSKKVSDKKIIEIAPILISKLVYSVISLNNKKYNEASKTTNMNKIKAIMHNEAINKILASNIKYDRIIVDGFTTTSKYYEYLHNKDNIVRDVELITGGEDKFISIAAASIIARYYFLKAIYDLSKKYNYDLPKGAGKPVDEVLKKIIQDNNKDILVNIAKVNFKNTIKVKL